MSVEEAGVSVLALDMAGVASCVVHRRRGLARLGPSAEKSCEVRYGPAPAFCLGQA